MAAKSKAALFCTSFGCGGRERDAVLKDHEGEFGCSISITYGGAKPLEALNKNSATVYWVL